MTSVLDFFYTLIVFPVESIIEAIFNTIRHFLFSLGVAGAIAGVSLAVNFLALPIYNMADAQQMKERETKKKLAHWVSRIRKTFRGDERFMMLSYYYRINHYHPAYALRETASILVQVPFFIAAYHFLSNCIDLKNASFWLIKDLGSPDALLQFAGMRLNVLPIAMTVINIVSGIIYTKGAPLREKLQSPILALLFLFLLYNSPSGLVFYWTLNNLFSLAKNAVKTFCPKPWIAVQVFICVVCVAAVWHVYFVRQIRAKSLVCIFLSIPVFLPLGKFALSKVLRVRGVLALRERSLNSLFLVSCVAACLLMGLVLPAALISTSPTEFSFLGATDSPLSYIASTFVFSLGLCLLWPSCIYFMADRKYRPVLVLAMCLLTFSMLLNVWVFKHDYGNVLVTGEVERWGNLHYNSLFLVLGPIAAAVVSVVLPVFFLLHEKGAWIRRFMLSICVALSLYGIGKIVGIEASYRGYRQVHEMLHADADVEGLPLEPVFHLSKTGKNVVRIFLDRSIGIYVPYIMQQFPDLLETYRGFTLYPNTVSFSSATIEGAPALFGGYEYTPAEINKRQTELLNDKTNEAQLVLPRLFSEAGWSVTITDPVYTSYGNIVNKDFLKDCPAVNEIYTVGRYSSRYLLDNNLIDSGLDKLVKKGIVRFFLLQALYPPLRYYFYAAGRSYTNSSAPSDFINDYSTLYYLSGLTDAEAEGDTYTLLYNLTAHDVVPLIEPDYHPGLVLPDMLNADNVHTVYPYQSTEDLILYECNAAALLQIGKWLDALRAMGVYDNTRIIIVADHGPGGQPFLGEGVSLNSAYGLLHTLLMEKDFGATDEFKADGSFMTNADSVWMTLDGLGVPNINPYTGKEICEGSMLKAGGVNLFMCPVANPGLYIGKTQYPIDINRGYHVSDDIYKESNWVPFADWVREHPEDMPRGAEK